MTLRLALARQNSALIWSADAVATALLWVPRIVWGSIIWIWPEASKNAELLVLRHENTVLRRQLCRVRYQPGGRLWLAALSRLLPRRRWEEVFHRDPAALLTWHRRLVTANGTTPAGGVPGDRPPNADFHAAYLASWSGELEAKAAAVPPGDGGVGGEAGLAEDG